MEKAGESSRGIRGSISSAAQGAAPMIMLRQPGTWLESSTHCV